MEEQRQKDVILPPGDNHTIATKMERPQQERNKQSLDYAWRSGLAGGMAGISAKSVVAPLDRVKILFQTSNPQYAKYTGSWFGVGTAMKGIYKDEGILGLFRGHSATLLKYFPYAAIKFLAYEQVRSVFISRPEEETPIRRLLSGSTAGVISVFLTYPLEVIRVRLAFETKKDSRSSLSSICKKIYNERPPNISPSPTASSPPGSIGAKTVTKKTAETVRTISYAAGLSNFFRGFAPTILGMLPYAGISFLTHDTAGDILRSAPLARYTTIPRPVSMPGHKPTPLLRSWAELLSGGIAGLVSQTASYPLEVIRRRMQVGGVVGDGHRLRIGETAMLIWGEKGFRGFWVGLSIGYVKVVPMAAVSFYVYERGKLLLGI